VKARTFVDAATVYATAGAGGSGSVSFRREKFVAHGGPDGGDGGRGGHITARGDRDTSSLIHLYYAPHQRAGHGGPGRGKQQHGANGKDLTIKVPCGTEIWDATGGVLLVDIVEHGQEHVITPGGKGGLGNCHWKTSTHQAPREHTDGEPATELVLRLELKLVANIGLVGFPNAGKSSLLTALSDAHPKVAAYPFTTLNPIIGTLIFEDYSRLTMADIPGLIEGAHDGVGLGHAFLRHVERAPALIYVLDMAAVDGRTPEDDIAVLRRELSLHREGLADRPSLVVANKMDLPESHDALREFTRQTGEEPIPVSARSGAGIDVLKQAIHGLFKTAQQNREPPPGHDSSGTGQRPSTES